MSTQATKKWSEHPLVVVSAQVPKPKQLINSQLQIQKAC
jgi:hypothetical protein